MKFVFDTDWMDSLTGCSAEVRLEVYEAVIRYAASGTLSALKPTAKLAFSFIKSQIDSGAAYSSMMKELGRKGAQKRWGIAANSYANSGYIAAINTEKEAPEEKVTPKELPEEKEQEKDIDKSISKKKDPRVVFVESLPRDWREVVEYWLKYKSERRENYKSKQSLEVFYNKLVRDSEQSVSRAKEMIDQSIANNWSGVFSIKDKPRYSTSSSDSRAPLPKDYTGYYEPVGHEI